MTKNGRPSESAPIVVNGGDGRVRKLAHEPGGGDESAGRRRIEGKAFVEGLDGDRPRENRVHRPIHHPRAAVGDYVEGVISPR
jgi:hypothetical protein